MYAASADYDATTGKHTARWADDDTTDEVVEKANLPTEPPDWREDSDHDESNPKGGGPPVRYERDEEAIERSIANIDQIFAFVGDVCLNDRAFTADVVDDEGNAKKEQFVLPPWAHYKMNGMLLSVGFSMNYKMTCCWGYSHSPSMGRCSFRNKAQDFPNYKELPPTITALWNFMVKQLNQQKMSLTVESSRVTPEKRIFIPQRRFSFVLLIICDKWIFIISLILIQVKQKYYRA